jgi:hypothetical protein
MDSRDLASLCLKNFVWSKCLKGVAN